MDSTLWDVQDYLLEALEGEPLFAKVPRQLGAPATFQPEMVWVSGEVDEWNLDYRQSGFVARDEEFVVRIHSLVIRTGRSYKDARDRVQQFGAAVDALIAADHTLGGIVMSASLVRAQLDEAAAGTGNRRALLLTQHVRCKAHVPDTVT